MRRRSRLRKTLLARARENRRNPTSGEANLWEALRSRNLAELKWRRQHVLTPYIPDFYCAEAKLVVEVDGPSHDDRQRSDDVRDDYLREEYGVETMRISEAAAIACSDELLTEIAELAHARIADAGDTS